MSEKVADGEQTRKKRYEPTDDDYELTRVSFDKAENGIVVNCGWTIKDEVKDMMRKKNDGMCGFGGEYYPDEKHVFEKMADAKAFVMKELNSLWPDGEDD